MDKIYDVIIVGAGPAGLAAGLYAGRSRLSTLIVEKEKDGGQIVQTAEIDNYPGSIEGETGPSLVERFSAQAQKFGAEKIIDTVTDMELEGNPKKIIGQKETYLGKTVILAGGAMPTKIGCPGEDEFTGKGVSYCATCDAAFFEGFEVYVVGGGDAAVEEAMHLTKFARKVTVIHRRDELRAVKAIQEKAFKIENLEFMWNSVVKELSGDGLLSRMVVEDTKSGEQREILADEEDGIFGVFVFIGYKPNTGVLEGKLPLENGYVKTDDDMKTTIPGVFAAGDIRVKSLRQVVTAAADGAIAATQAGKYIENLEG
ncbi:MAG: thioredoxin-disulfide reductase [Eubacteriales bacterium]|jgi:thioredoxin reductase (NADPH)|nr:thioredoxin-disulfide reductase [Eubacteriales bacterium]MDD3290477.1 thioredoxin-disulfide reductase [Eubacteriales bacterium]MDD3864672.1 thioredoxin-disulfide reductase [Eubacteriales bacterium]MDD4444853.1 thioredoxin-disulfide reductase [Eubacteriales bacterium]